MDPCDSLQTANSGTYQVEVRVNGVTVDTLTVKRTHNLSAQDAITLTGHTILNLARNSVITLHLVPLTDDKYYVGPSAARLTVKKEPWF